MLWTNSALTHLHYIFVTYTRCVLCCLLYTSVLNIVESQYFSQCIEKVVITIIVRMSQYRYTVVFSYHFISNETYIRLLGSPVPVNKSVSQLLEHLNTKIKIQRTAVWILVKKNSNPTTNLTNSKSCKGRGEDHWRVKYVIVWTVRSSAPDTANS